MPELYENAQRFVSEGGSVPVMRNYYYRLYQIDHRLTENFYPINQAIRMAIEEVLAYYSYRGTRRAS